MNIPINETKPTDDELDLYIQVIPPCPDNCPHCAAMWRPISRAEALELFPMSPHPIPEPTAEMLRATERLDGWLVVTGDQFRDPEMIESARLQHLQLINRDALQEVMECCFKALEPAVKFVEPIRDHGPRPSFRERFPNDPVRNRRARKSWRRR